jgi:hypothetical protein
MNCQSNVNSVLTTQLPHKFSYIVAIPIHNPFLSPDINVWSKLLSNFIYKNVFVKELVFRF